VKKSGPKKVGGAPTQEVGAIAGDALIDILPRFGY
jgi:hypothetical protein